MAIRIGTHDGRFHSDEVLAIAALLILYPDAEIVRTRDVALLATCNLRVDAGRKYNPLTGDHDHHQEGGAGTRDNGIEFSSFGLIWKEFGVRITGDQEVARYVDKVLVQSVDARDNGQSLSVPRIREQTKEYTFQGVMPFEFASAIDAFNPSWDETDRDPDMAFREAVDVGKRLLERLIARARSIQSAKPLVRQEIAVAEDPRLIILERGCPWHDVVITEAPNAVFVILPDKDGKWRVESIPRTLGTRDLRKSLPQAWKDLDPEAFAQVTGVPEAFFVHRKLFLCVATSFEGALRLARLALAA